MRIIQAPGIELHEIDRSGYDDSNDSSIVGTTAFLMGFADKGDDYATKYIRNLNSFIQNYGYPTNEAERYLYNAAYEVFNRGGNVCVSKLPYYNNSWKKYSFCTYSVGDTVFELSDDYSELTQIDGQISTCVRISADTDDDSSGMMTMDDLDKYRTNVLKPDENKILIVNTKRQKYVKDKTYKSDNGEYIGILPVITTAANAAYFQNIISSDITIEKRYNPLSCIRNCHTDTYELNTTDLNNDNTVSKKIAGFTQYIGPEQDVTEDDVTISETAVSYFPTLTFKDDILDNENLKKIGIVVFQMFIDTSNNNKIGIQPIESFIGSLNKKSVDSITKSSNFIDFIVNQNSQYINCFTNVKFANPDEAERAVDKCQIFTINDQVATSLGFYEEDCIKQISLEESIINAIDMIFDNNKDYNRTTIDIVVDAGVSNIAQFIQSVYPDDGYGYFDLTIDEQQYFKLDSKDDAKIWLRIINKYDNFCKNVRKDCMFLADCPRPFCLTGDEKLVRYTKPENTVESCILPKLKYISGKINSSYGAGYCDWFRAIDHYSNDYFWCPPSIKASGVYIYTDAYSYYWNAPAGLRRGKMLDDVIDIAFNPTNDEAGKIYVNNWNYAMSYPLNGIIQEGQRTFQKEKTAFDRVNVRRLFLGLEKTTRYIAKFFTYEGITQYLMQRFVDSLTPIFENAKTNYGLIDYVIICDDRNNNTTTIENNELHCTIAVKPVKTLEFIVMNFVATSQGADVTEVAEQNL